MEDAVRGLRRMRWLSCERRRRKSRTVVFICARVKRESAADCSACCASALAASVSACWAQVAMKVFSASVAAGSKGRFLRRSLRDSISVMHAGRKCSRQRERPAKSTAALALQDAAAHQVASWRGCRSGEDAI